MYNKNDDYKAWLRKEKRSYTVAPLFLGLFCIVVICVVAIRGGSDCLSELFTREDGYFLSHFLASIILFPLLHLIMWLGIKYLEPKNPEIKFSDIDPIARILISIANILLRR